MRPTILNQAILAWLIVLFFGTGYTSAQELLKDEDRAIFQLDIDVKRLRENEFIKDIGVDSVIKALGLNSFGAEEFPPEKIERVIFAGHCEDYDEFARYRWDGDLPFSFYVQVDFDKFESLERLLNSIKELPSEMINGKRYLRPPEDTNVKNWLACVDGNKLIIGSDNYVLHDSLDFLTDRLQKQIDQLPADQMILAVADCQDSKPFLKAIIDDGMLLPPELKMFARTLLKVNNVGVVSDLESKMLFRLTATANNDEEATEVQDALSQQLNMAKIGLSMLSTELETEAGKESFQAMLSQLKPSRENNTITINIQQPEGFVDLVADVATKMRQQAAKANRLNQIRQLAIAAHNYESAYRRFPFNLKEGSPESSELSWRVRILPFMEEIAIWESINRNENASHESNAAYAEQMPKAFGSDGANANFAWINSEVDSLQAITDGLSNTIMLIEYPKGQPWMETNDLSILETIRLVKSLEDGERLAVARYDGSATFISNKLSHNHIKALLTPAGGEVIEVELGR